jgi:hypothetical protein
MAFERIDLKKKGQYVAVGLGTIRFPEDLFAAEFVSVEIDKKLALVRLTSVEKEDFQVYRTGGKCYHGIPFSAIANCLNICPQIKTAKVPHRIEDGKLILDLSGIEKWKIHAT